MSSLKYHGTLPVCGIPILLETYDDKVPNPNRDQGESIPRSTPTFDLLGVGKAGPCSKVSGPLAISLGKQLVYLAWGRAYIILKAAQSSKGFLSLSL